MDGNLNDLRVAIELGLGCVAANINIAVLLWTAPRYQYFRSRTIGGNGLGECFARRIEHDAARRTRVGGLRTGETGFERDDSTRTNRGESHDEVVEVVAGKTLRATVADAAVKLASPG